MTDPREEIIRRGFEISNGGDREAVLELIDPDIEVIAETQAGAPTVYRGHDGYRAWDDGWHEVWKDVRWEVGEIEQHGDHFLVSVETHGRGRGSGIALSQKLIWVFTIPDERPTRIHLVVDREAALEAIRA